MELIEIIRWISIVLLWLCIALNLWCMWRLTRSRKDVEKVRLKLECGINEVESLRENGLSD